MGVLGCVEFWHASETQEGHERFVEYDLIVPTKVNKLSIIRRDDRRENEKQSFIDQCFLDQISKDIFTKPDFLVHFHILKLFFILYNHDTMMKA